MSDYQHRGSVLVTAPTTEPVTVGELITHLQLDAGSAQDQAAAADLITDARMMIEEATGIAFIAQSWRLSIDRWPAGREAWWDGVRQMAISELHAPNSTSSVSLPRWPLASVTSVTVYDEASVSSAVTVGSTFDVDAYQVPGRMTLKSGSTWPVAARANNAIQIVYVAGYANAAAVPSVLKRAIKQLAAFLYANRGDGCTPADAMNKSGADNIMNNYRPMRV